MNVQQRLFLLVLPKWKKADANGEAPVYVRIRIDGEEDELSLGCKTKIGEWDQQGRG